MSINLGASVVLKQFSMMHVYSAEH